MTITHEIKVKDCGNSWCDLDAGCKGHTVKAQYTTSVDIGSIYIDDQLAFSDGDNLLQAIIDAINEILE